MPAVFKTKTNSEDPVAIMGVGVLGAKGKGGVVVAAAAPFMSELQEKDEHGQVVTDDDGNPVVLTGKKLEEAAKQFAEERDLRVVNVSDKDVPNLKVEAGALPEPEPAREVSQRLGGFEVEAEEEAEQTGLPQAAPTPEDAEKPEDRE